ncbi:MULTISPECIES: class F sortase [unclassified Streptomyces]|uniref:class F sortase n=1 Tax=unclassified Streptomyces TaxID=2593676 RepID=UPI003D71687E
MSPRRTAAALFTLLAAATLLGCGSDHEEPPATPPAHVRPTTAAPASPAETVRPMAAAKPVRVRIPAAGVDTGPVLELGLAADGTVEVPPAEQADRIGWYDKGVTPGETGPAVLIGHFDTAKGPAVLRNVARIEAGDTISVSRADGTTADFRVREIEQVDKKTFPTDKVYGNTTRPELRLITCGGDLVDGHRPDNIILYADLVA